MTSPTNEEIVLRALLALGGDLDPIHIEDIAVRADQMAPGRFRWQRYADQINLQAIYKALKDSRARGNVRGSPTAGYMLADSGLGIARLRSPNVVPYQDPISRQDRAWMAKEKQRLTTEPAYLKFRSGAEQDITQRDALRFFLLDEYVVGDMRKGRIDRLIRLFGNDSGLSEAVQRIAGKVPQ